ncbi:MAG: hypothetical protein EBR82_36630 [Caulobacteraceae bacterium]|nr:hypothetical protein [Caulobacteraceae bacterium]
MSLVIVILAPLVGALLYRLRGGWLNDLVGWGQKTQFSRLAWAIPTAALMTWESGAPWWFAIVLTVTNFASLAMFGTGQYLQDVPLRREPDWLGLARNSLAAVPLVLYSPIMFAAYAGIGLLHALFYWLGHRTGYNSQAGECIVGAVAWFVIVVAS